MRTTPEIEADFSSDLRDHFIAELRAAGAQLEWGKTDVRTAGIAFYNLRSRLIPQVPRQTLISRRLKSKIPKLSRGARAQLEIIVEEIRTGADLNRRLSKRVLARPLYSDGLYVDWGVSHLHVGPIEHPHGKELLYVYFASERAHLVTWSGHGVETMADQEMVQILHDDWPDAIAHMRAPGVVPGSLGLDRLTPEQRDKMRRKFTIGTQVADGIVYLPYGHGVTLSGSSMQVTVRVNRQLRENADGLQKAIVGAREVRLDLLKLKYHVGNFPRVEELQTGVVVDLARSW